MINRQFKQWLLPAAFGLMFGGAYLLFIYASQFLNSSDDRFNSSGFADELESILPYTVSILSNQIVANDALELNIDPYFEKFIASQPAQQSSLGSGIIINSQGDVVTNAHVINNAENIIVVLSNGTQAVVSEVSIDPDTDIALLRTNVSVNKAPPMGDSKKLRVGDIVFTVGNPFGVGQSVSMGIVSATGRQQPGLTTLTDFIQTDAAINPGNSGGALVDKEGRVVGMNAAIFSSTGGNQGIGFAIPIEQVVSIINELSSKGSVSRGHLGIDVVETVKEDSSFAIQIVSVQSGSPAETSGILVQDELTHINDIPVSSRTHAARLISQFKPNETIILTVNRGNDRYTIQTTLSAKPN